MPEARQVLCAGSAAGDVLTLDEPLSFWGGFDAADGTIVDPSHPQVGARLTGRIVLMRGGRGSSSASSVLAEAIRQGTAPAALVLRESDEIIALGAIVADELYGIAMPVVIVDADDYDHIARASHVTVTGASITVG